MSHLLATSLYSHTYREYIMMNFCKAIFQVLCSINLSSRLSVWFTQHWISLRGNQRYLNPRLWSPSPLSHFPIFSTPQHSSSSTCPAVVVDNNSSPQCIWESSQHKKSAWKNKIADSSGSIPPNHNIKTIPLFVWGITTELKIESLSSYTWVLHGIQ